MRVRRAVTEYQEGARARRVRAHVVLVDIRLRVDARGAAVDQSGGDRAVGGVAHPRVLPHHGADGLLSGLPVVVSLPQVGRRTPPQSHGQFEFMPHITYPSSHRESHGES